MLLTQLIGRLERALFATALIFLGTTIDTTGSLVRSFMSAAFIGVGVFIMLGNQEDK